MSDDVIVCADCGTPWVLTADEDAFLRALARERGFTYHPPRRCVPCRAKRRLTKYGTAAVDDGVDETLVCDSCQGEFIFGGRDKVYFASRGFHRPRHCRPCRQARANGRT